MNDRIYVAGATGYVGRNVTRSLSEAGYETVALSRNNPNIENVEWIKYDMLDYENVSSLNLEGATVVNCAAVTKDKGKASEFIVNYSGVMNMSEMMPEGKLIQISSSSIYNLESKHEFVKESDYSYHNYALLNNYSHTKSLAEYLLSSRGNHSVVSLRPHGVYGRDDTTLLPKLADRVRWLKRGVSGFLMLPNGGNVRHSLTHIDNLMSAVKLAIGYSPVNRFEAFNITDSEPVNLQQAILGYMRRDIPTLNHLKFTGPTTEFLSNLANKFPNRLSSYEIAQIGNNRTYDISKAVSLLGYSPDKFKVL